MSFRYDQIEGDLSMGELGVEGPAGSVDLAIVSYGNGAYLSRRAIRELEADGLRVRLIDLRWLTPLNIDGLCEQLQGAAAALVVDECRRSGSVSEAVITGLVENGVSLPMRRLTAEDSFIPLAAASYQVLPSQAGIVAAARSLLEQGKETSGGA
jgi:2-oxoisovalerate dehydrogenase E1 component